MQIERRSKNAYLTWQFLLRMAGAIFFGPIFIFGAYHSFTLASDIALIPIIATLLLLVSLLGIPAAVYSMRIGHRHSEQLLRVRAESISIPFNRRPDEILVVSLLALLPELYLWISIADERTRIFLWFLIGFCLLLACIALWNLFTPRASLIIDQEGFQLPDLLHGRIVWNELEEMAPVGDRLGLAFRTKPEVSLKKRPWFRTSARWARSDDRVLLLPMPLRYLSLSSLSSTVQSRTRLKVVVPGVAAKD